VFKLHDAALLLHDAVFKNYDAALRYHNAALWYSNAASLYYDAALKYRNGPLAREERCSPIGLRHRIVLLLRLSEEMQRHHLMLLHQ
jgi:hypothetical protein